MTQDSVWYTIIALTILKNYFLREAPKYVKVEKKARNSLTTKFTNVNVNDLIEKLKVQYKPYIP